MSIVVGHCALGGNPLTLLSVSDPLFPSVPLLNHAMLVGTFRVVCDNEMIIESQQPSN